MMNEDLPNDQRHLEEDLQWLGMELDSDPSWIREHQAHVCDVIGRGLNVASLYFATVDLLLKLLPAAFDKADNDAWFQSICELVATHPQEVNTPFKIGFREVMNDFRPFAGVFGALQTAAPEQLEALLQAYIKLFKALNYSHSRLTQLELLDEAQAVAQKLNKPLLTAKLDQTLGLYYAHYGDERLAMAHANKAFTYYEHVNDPAGIADSAATLAIICRANFHPKEADLYMERALNMAMDENHEKQHATLLYEQGVRCYQEKDFRFAQTFYEVALEVFVEYEAAYQITMTQQALAQVHSYLHNFEQARSLLLEARRGWEVIDVPYEWVNSFFVEGELELLRGDKPLARRILEDTIDKAKAKISDIPMREYLIKLIEEEIEQQFKSVR